METRPPEAPDTGVHRILVVANETVQGRELIDEIARRAQHGRLEVLVVAPALVESRIKHGLGDVDEAVEEARRRLDPSVETIRKIGVGAFMITLWHTVALILMGSVRYRGFWNAAAADMVLWGIPPAIVVSLLVG